MVPNVPSVVNGDRRSMAMWIVCKYKRAGREDRPIIEEFRTGCIGVRAAPVRARKPGRVWTDGDARICRKASMGKVREFELACRSCKKWISANISGL